MLTRFDAAVRGMDGVLVLVGRLLIALLFLPSGLGKLFGVGGPGVDKFSETLAQRGVPAPGLLGWIGALVEFFGPIFIAVGFKTRAAALLMALFTVAATLISHRYWEFSDAAQYVAQRTNFFKNVAILGGLLLLMARGAGPYSVDRDR
jgi:putative oxidoreductase